MVFGGIFGNAIRPFRSRGALMKIECSVIYAPFQVWLPFPVEVVSAGPGWWFDEYQVASGLADETTWRDP